MRRKKFLRIIKSFTSGLGDFYNIHPLKFCQAILEIFLKGCALFTILYFTFERFERFIYNIIGYKIKLPEFFEEKSFLKYPDK